jgi:hypothetical protein
MQRYGNKKRGSSKIHPHDTCGICSEIKITKGGERNLAKREILNQIISFKTTPSSSD